MYVIPMFGLSVLPRLLIFVVLLACVSANEKPWPNRVCYYRIDKKAPKVLIKKFRTAADIIERNTCVRFVERTKGIDTFVKVYSDKYCWSTIGFSTHNAIGLNPEYHLSSYIHELLHTLGFYHMHQFENRDDHVFVFKRNI